MATGLVLEGGGTRGSYTAGVLDVFLEKGIEFPSVYGISAGACNAVSYISKQPKRNLEIFYKYIGDERYLSVANLRKTGSLFGFGFIFGELSRQLVPLDYETFQNSPVKFRVGATNVVTGKVVYFDKEDITFPMDVLRASASLPMISPIVDYKGYHLLDGGVACPIPIERSIFDGNEKNVLVLTRDITYRKRARPEFPRAVLRSVYRDYPKLVDAMMNRPDVYNSQLDLITRLEKEGKAVVVRPSSPLAVGRYEKNREKLLEIYKLGRKDALKKLAEIRSFLQENI
ncbi:MAG: patatin family protein [Clostridium sp.]